MNARARGPSGIPLLESDRRRLSQQVLARGEPVVLRALGLSRNSLARALAGLTVHRGTVALVEDGLGKLEAEDARLASAEAMAATDFRRAP